MKSNTAARGGTRAGAGRKKGTLTRRTQEIVAKATAEGITPLEVMLQAMRQSWEAGNIVLASGFAEKAAPYVHPRLAAVEHSGDKENPVAMQILTGVPREKTEDKPVKMNGSNGHANGHDPAH